MTISEGRIYNFRRSDLNIKGGEEAIELIRAAGGEATFVKCDVSKAVEVEAMVARANVICPGLTD